MFIEQLKAWLKEVFGPGAYEFLVEAYYATLGTVLAEPRLRLALILPALGVVLIVYLVGARSRRSIGGFLHYSLPRRVLLHPSAVLDYKFFAVNQLVMGHLRLGRWVGGLVALLFVADLAKWLLTAAFGPGPARAVPSIAATLAFTATTLLAWDFAKYVAHYVTHKVPVLWEFHKVHHAAEVLTPISAFRAHPIDIMIDLSFRLAFTGFVAGAFAYIYPGGIVELTILGFNALAMCIYYWIAHLQHSHIPLGYGRLSGLLVSPVMHQVHHSREEQHWDRNFGFVFSVWDRLFGTLYVPRRDEPFRLGLPDGSGEFHTLRDLYVAPFANAGRRLLAKKAAGPVASQS